MNFRFALLLPCLTSLGSLATAAPDDIASAAVAELRKGIPGSYIVVLKKDVSHSVFRRHMANADSVFSTGTYHGYSTTGYSQEQADALALCPAVSS